MGLGKADLQEKILCCTGKICLIISGILHILFSILVFCSIAYVYGQKSEKSALYLLAPSIMAVFSALGAFLFLCCFRKQLIILISLGWPVLLFLITLVVYAVIFHEFIARNYEKAQKLGLKKMQLPMEIINMFFMSISLIFIPLACHCGFVLICLGCCKTAVEEDEHWESIDDEVGVKHRGRKGNY